MTVEEELAALKKEHSQRWPVAKILPGKLTVVQKAAKRLLAEKQRYLHVEDRTKVPWYVVAVIHEREASQNFRTQLGQGDPLDRVSTHVPKGRGPFKTWEDGAFDALVKTAPFLARWQDWSPAGTLTALEQYNGLGYIRRGRPSPYIYAATDQYIEGKYVADGKYDPTFVDPQLGCAALLKEMMALDTSIKMNGEKDGNEDRNAVTPGPSAS